MMRIPKDFAAKRRAAIRARFRDVRRRQIAALVPLGGVLLLVSRSGEVTRDLGAAPMAAAVVFLLAAVAAFTWLNWRCPRCRAHLGRRVRPERCPRCGVPLVDP